MGSLMGLILRTFSLIVFHPVVPHFIHKLIFSLFNSLSNCLFE